MESRRRMMMSAVQVEGQKDNNIYLHLIKSICNYGECIYTYAPIASYPVSSDIAVYVYYDSVDEDGFIVPADMRYVIRTGKTQGAASDGIAGIDLRISEITDMIITPKEDSKYRYVANTIVQGI